MLALMLSPPALDDVINWCGVDLSASLKSKNFQSIKIDLIDYKPLAYIFLLILLNGD